MCKDGGIGDGIGGPVLGQPFLNAKLVPESATPISVVSD